MSFALGRRAFPVLIGAVLGVTSYDGQGHELKSVTKERARYVYKITVEPAAQTVTF